MGGVWVWEEEEEEECMSSLLITKVFHYLVNEAELLML